MELTPDLLKTVAFISRLAHTVKVSKGSTAPWTVFAKLPPGWEFQTLDVDKTIHIWTCRTKVRAEEFRALIIAGLAARMIQNDAYVSPMIAFPCLKFVGYPETPAAEGVEIPATPVAKA